MAGFKQIKIFTDSNIIHTNQSHLLVSSAVSAYIAEHKKIESVSLKWYLPSMVLKERKHQMLSAAIALSPKIFELEKLLGHSLAISEEIMSDRVDSKIKKTLNELDLEICQIDTKAVDWEEIIERSALRQPPFEISQSKEKGFRDAIIATSFLQEAKNSPTTPRSCMLVFVSGDKRIREYINEKTEDVDNIRLLENLDELKSFLNAIASEVTEEFLKKLLPKAKTIFYDFETEKGLYVKENVYEQITRKYINELNSIVSSNVGDMRRNNGVTIGQQTFISKTEQTIVWSTAIILKFEILKIDFDLIKEKIESPASASKVIDTGESKFSVVWQHQISTKGNIIRSKINSIDFIENILDITF